MQSYSTVLTRFLLANLMLIVLYIVEYVALQKFVVFVFATILPLLLQYFVIVLPFYKNQKLVNRFVVAISMGSDKNLTITTVKTFLFKSMEIHDAEFKTMSRATLEDMGEVIELAVSNFEQKLLIPVKWYDTEQLQIFLKELNDKKTV